MNRIDAGMRGMPSRASLLGACIAQGELMQCMPGERTAASHGDAFELLWLQDGELDVAFGDRRVHLEAGAVLLVPPGWMQHWRCARPTRLFHTQIALEAPSLAAVLRRESLRAIRAPGVRHAVAALAGTLGEAPRDAAQELRLLRALLAFVASLDDADDACEEIGEEGGADDGSASHAGPMLHAARDDIAERLAAAMSERVARGEAVVLATLAAAEGVCPGYANRLFHQRFGMAPREYLARCREERACALLTGTALSLEAIAERLGFGEASHFTRQFKRWTGVAPSAFRAGHTPRGAQREKRTVFTEKSIAL